MRLTIDGAHFDVRDEGEGTPIVLLHGFPLSNETWDVQAAALAGAARVVRYDQRGLGSTTATPGPYLMEQLAGDLAEILDAARIERAVVVGHSLGGYVALAFFRMFAERCLGLGLVCSRTGADTPAAAETRRALADRAEREGMAPIVEAFVPKFFAPQIYTDRPDIVERVRGIVERTDPRGAAGMLRGMAERVDSSDLFEEMALPVAVLAGSEDAMIAPDAARAVGASVPSAEVTFLPCGHFPQLEVPDLLSEALVTFAGRCAAGQGVRL